MPSQRGSALTWIGEWVKTDARVSPHPSRDFYSQFRLWESKPRVETSFTRSPCICSPEGRVLMAPAAQCRTLRSGANVRFGSIFSH